MSCPVLALAQQLIARPSLSPDDAGCQAILSARLQRAGFQIESLPFGDTLNLWAWRGQGEKTLVFAGHTDVVPPGDEQQWRFPPFSATVEDGQLYGRGAADMKGSLAAMIVAAERFVAAFPEHQGRLAFLITADEEASAVNGTVKVVDALMRRQERLDYCVVGEPTSAEQVGDTIKQGRRGSLTADLIVHGVQGHVAYPQLAENPVHRALPFLQTLTDHRWDEGNDAFPPTTLQIANIHAGTGSTNVIPGDLHVQFNLRFSTALTAEQIQQQVEAMLEQHQLRYSLRWTLSGQPFLTASGELLDAACHAVRQHQRLTPALSTSGGTSDGRFIARTGAQVIELGPVNATIHKVNECVSVAELQQLSRIYQTIMEQLLLR